MWLWTSLAQIIWSCKISKTLLKKVATSQFSMSQMIKEPAHILSNSISCIDLIFTSKPKLHSVLHSSLHPNCHHQVVFTRFNLTMFYPLPYKRLVLQYQQANTDLIKWALYYLTRKKVFLILTSINKFLFSVKQSWTSLKILLCTKQTYAMVKILSG